MRRPPGARWVGPLAQPAGRPARQAYAEGGEHLRLAAFLEGQLHQPRPIPIHHPQLRSLGGGVARPSTANTHPAADGTIRARGGPSTPELGAPAWGPASATLMSVGDAPIAAGGAHRWRLRSGAT